MTDISIQQLPVHEVLKPASLHVPVKIWFWLANEHVQVAQQVRYWFSNISAPMGTLGQMILEMR